MIYEEQKFVLSHCCGSSKVQDQGAASPESHLFLLLTLTKWKGNWAHTKEAKHKAGSLYNHPPLQ